MRKSRFGDGEFKSILMTKKARALPRYESSEIVQGPLLGMGCYCGVYEVSSIQFTKNPNFLTQEILQHVDKSISTPQNNECKSQPPSTYDTSDADNLSCDDDYSIDSCGSLRQLLMDSLTTREDISEEESTFNEKQARASMKKNCRRGDYARYALKKFKGKKKLEFEHLLSQKRDTGDAGLLELHTEMCFLRSISHPNIIKIRGVASTSSKSPNYFLILDRLFSTLREKMRGDWTKRHDECKKKFGIDSKKKKAKRLNLWSEKLLAAYDLSSAFRYLQKN